MKRWRLRPATAGDLLAIERIENASFGNPWLADVYAQEIERDIGRVEVAQADDGAILGVFCVWCIANESHLMRIATAPEHRRQGIGRVLLQAAIERARAAGCDHMTLEVAESNEAAIELYAALGFGVVGRRPGYYRAPPDDALLMRCELEPGSMAEVACPPGAPSRETTSGRSKLGGGSKRW